MRTWLRNYLIKPIRETYAGDKKDGFGQERLFRGVAKMPIYKSHSGLVEMDFVAYGDMATFLHLKDTFRDIQRLYLLVIGRRWRNTAGKVVDVILTHWVRVFDTPDIIIADKGPRFTDAEVAQFLRGRNITLQPVIPGHHQSVGATERRRRYCKGNATNC